MRLIDADALGYRREMTFVEGQFREARIYVTQEDIDAAPTVCCEECADIVGCDVRRAVDTIREWRFGCWRFERRQP